MADEKHLGDSIIEYFGLGTLVEIYLSETSGVTKYADNDVEQKVCVAGKLKGAIGKGLILEVEVTSPVKTVVKDVMINDWAITGVMKYPNDGVHITHIFQEYRR